MSNIPTSAEVQKRDSETDFQFSEIVSALHARGRLLVITPIVVGAIAVGVSFLVPPTYTARTMFLPPQPAQNTAATALASLGGALSGLAGLGVGGVKTTADQYISLMESVNVQDKLIDRFGLMKEYDAKYRFQARKELSQNVRISLGKKDGLITLEAEASSPAMAADLANAHVDELRRLTGELALTEAQQRRVFFEKELKRTRDRLTQAQLELQRSGFNPGAMKAEPKAAADAYARIKAEVTAADVKLQTMQRTLADSAPEVLQQRGLLGALRAQLAKLESADNGAPTDVNYIGKYREYKYQESLFELFARQFEAARLEESREGGLIQVVDVATPPERKSRPKRLIYGVIAAFGSLLAVTFAVLLGHIRQRAGRRATPTA
ncbi:Wzz/FepE/Etk N-terminal domain-containing protein [Roseateles sp.]|uniref:Wzz/FepE/Etk N-terminal domain-containing protein n=1 Tax=Roseateles sp. TaxID=1971397 RepID=UPI0031DDE7E5